MSRALLLAPLLAACSYHSGSYEFLWQNFPGQRLTTECLDLAVTRDDQGYTLGPVVGYSFGNRCGHRVPIDLPSVRVVARSPGGDIPLHPYDPQAQLRVAQLVALGGGQEFIEYRDNQGTPAREMGQVCVDIGPIEASGPHPERWVCVGGPR
jgi:hypothetical protein